MRDRDSRGHTHKNDVMHLAFSVAALTEALLFGTKEHTTTQPTHPPPSMERRNVRERPHVTDAVCGAFSWDFLLFSDMGPIPNGLQCMFCLPNALFKVSKSCVQNGPDHRNTLFLCLCGSSEQKECKKCTVFNPVCGLHFEQWRPTRSRL